ncbi:unnamed protein product [Hymenolepis diminuta]|uniref:Integrase catalytic domain-containing protein n=1 Tax=Hymenolepis diminuta TaxID=6216 RepID=A0A564XVJ8_HYMDI|nr:unnamed protein product [Hymenolepis diminuta]
MKPMKSHGLVLHGHSRQYVAGLDSFNKRWLFSELINLLGTNRIRTNAYHPQANGLVERFHCQLKAVLAAHCTPERWTEVLLLVLLGIRTAVKEDLNCPAAEMVFGVSLKLPSQFVSPSDKSFWPNPVSYVERLRSHMQNLQGIGEDRGPICVTCQLEETYVAWTIRQRV